MGRDSPGDTWEKTIYGAIESTHSFIFVLTPNSIASEVCGREIAHAAANNKRLVPIVHRDVTANRVPKSLGELNWIFCRDCDDFEKAADTLISALDTDLNWVPAHNRLLTRAIEWNANGKNNSFVLRGHDQRSKEQWLAQAGTHKEPTALQTEYIIASKEDETQTALAATKKIGEVGSRGRQSGKNLATGCCCGGSVRTHAAKQHGGIEKCIVQKDTPVEGQLPNHSPSQGQDNKVDRQQKMVKHASSECDAS